jgi:hypothetical protein
MACTCSAGHPVPLLRIFYGHCICLFEATLVTRITFVWGGGLHSVCALHDMHNDST